MKKCLVCVCCLFLLSGCLSSTIKEEVKAKIISIATKIDSKLTDEQKAKIKTLISNAIKDKLLPSISNEMNEYLTIMVTNGKITEDQKTKFLEVYESILSNIKENE